MRKITKSEAHKLLENKKIFVGNDEISEQVQKQLFKAGFRWTVDGTRCTELNSIFLFTNKDAIITRSKCNMTYYRSIKEELSAMEILNLDIIDDLSITLKFKDDVLVRNSENDEWVYSIYSHFSDGMFVVINGFFFTQCIPYEGNEDLLGTSNQPNNK